MPMDPDRLRWITRPATLDHFAFSVRLADTPTGPIATLHAEGGCDRKRGALWTHDETIAAAEDTYSLVDLVTHIVLVAVQDRPTSNPQFTRAMCGDYWKQDELPF